MNNHFTFSSHHRLPDSPASSPPQQNLKEFIDAITGRLCPGVHRVPTQEEILAFVDAITGGTASICERTWDPAKHPRRGGPPNAGWWTSTSGQRGARSAAHLPQGSGSSEATFSLASWHPAVGHHPVSVGVTIAPDIRPFLSDEAVAYAAGAYSGPTSPHHGNTTVDQITHHKYNKAVKTQLEVFIKNNKISVARKMTGAQMEEFTRLTTSGLDANGQPHEIIARYNRGINKLLPKGSAAVSRRFSDVLAAGQKYMKHSRFRLLAAGAVVSTIVGEVIAAQTGLLEVASSSGHFERAIQQLQSGNLGGARLLLIGDDKSLYSEIMGKVGAHAAIHFKRTMERVFADAANREYK